MIQPSTIELRPEGTVSFQFQVSPDDTRRFQLQAATSLGPGAAWESQPSATITERMPGHFQATVPLNARVRSSFFRIVASPSPAGPLFINEVMSDNEGRLADAEGRYWDWIEIYNPADGAVDARGYGLSDDEQRPHEWQFPAVLIQPGGFVIVFATGLDAGDAGKDLHASFKLNAGGEGLYLAAPDGSIIDRLQIPALARDQSLGRFPNGSETWQIYPRELATPGAPNPATSLGPPIPPPQFLVNERFFPAGAEVNVALAAPESGRTIRFTTDGAAVNATSASYANPLLLTRTTVVRAVAFEGSRASAETAATFFIGATHDLPVVSLAAAPGNFEFKNGFLYGMGSSVLGSSGQVLQNFPFSGSNAWKDREVAVSLEFYEPDHRLGLQLQAGLKIFGGWGSRGYPQKSFALFAREQYGDGKFKHRIFPDKPIKEFETFVLRNSGNDNQSTHQTAPRSPITAFGAALSYGSYFVNGSFTLMRDAMMQRLVQDIDLDTQAYRPAVLYINGEYWGIYNLREKINEHYVSGNHGLPDGQIDLIEGYGSVMAGDATAYRAMRDFIATRDLKVAANYATVEQKYLEIDNFIDYHLAVIYFQNFDIGNIKCWRSRTPNGRFRWILYDQDYGFNLWKPEVYLPAMARDYADYDNMFKFYTAGTGTSTGWPNEGGRTLLLRRLLTNDSFKERFIKRCADLLNSPFREEIVVRTIRQMAEVIRPEIARHLQRWNWAELQQRGFGRPHQAEYEPFTQETWEKNLGVLIDFAEKRPAKLRQDCIKHFSLGGELADVTIKISPDGSGRVQLNSLAVTNFPWSGVLFRDYPATVTAVPKPGYRFVEWVGLGTTTNQPQWQFSLAASTASLEARFELIPLASPPPVPAVFLTEIQYHPATTQDSGDWIELYNSGTEPVRLSGWILRDDIDVHDFLLPDIALPPGGYLVLCEAAARFTRIYPSATNYIGDFGFGLDNSGDTVRLFDSFGNPVLVLRYDDEAPWPLETDGSGHSLHLIDPRSYAPNAAAWKLSANPGGSPGLSEP